MYVRTYHSTRNEKKHNHIIAPACANISKLTEVLLGFCSAWWVASLFLSCGCYYSSVEFLPIHIYIHTYIPGMFYVHFFKYVGGKNILYSRTLLEGRTKTDLRLRHRAENHPEPQQKQSYTDKKSGSNFFHFHWVRFHMFNAHARTS